MIANNCLQFIHINIKNTVSWDFPPNLDLVKISIWAPHEILCYLRLKLCVRVVFDYAGTRISNVALQCLHEKEKVHETVLVLSWEA